MAIQRPEGRTIKDESIESKDIKNYSVLEEDIADGAILARHLGFGAVKPEHMDLSKQSGYALNYTADTTLVDVSTLDTWVKLKPDNERKDSIDEYDVATGNFTATRLGVYAAHVDMDLDVFNVTDYLHIGIFVNGSLLTKIVDYNENFRYTKNFKGNVYLDLAANDVVSFYIMCPVDGLKILGSDKTQIFVAKVV